MDSPKKAATRQPFVREIPEACYSWHNYRYYHLSLTIYFLSEGKQPVKKRIGEQDWVAYFFLFP